MIDETGPDPTLATLLERFVAVLDELAATVDEAVITELQHQAYDLAFRALQHPAGVAGLADLAPRFDAVGLFRGSDWAAPEALQPGLVEATLQTPLGVGIECCSQLRLLAIVDEALDHPKVTAEEARRFLERVLAWNLGSLFPLEPDEHLAASEAPIEPVQRLSHYIIDRLGLDGVMTRLVIEAERVLITRPIKVERIRRMIDTAALNMAAWGASEVAREAALLVDALHGPTPLCRACERLDQYADQLAGMDDPSLLLEADTMSTYVRRTGLVSPYHALLVRFAAGHGQQLLVRALGIEDTGRCCLDQFTGLVHDLIDRAVWPATAQCVNGLAQLLERGVLFNPPVVPGLCDLLELTVPADLAAEIQAGVPGDTPPPSAEAVLAAGILNVLGLPLGVDQGHNPTCQSARAISLWAQVEPGYLLHLVTQAVRDADVVMDFEGTIIHSQAVERGVADELHTELDTVSLILTPHLDRIYWEMSRLAIGRGEDEHRWVNPEFHGWWVYRDFAAIQDEDSGQITRPEAFVRLFFAAYHLDWNGGRDLRSPQPCGVAITNSDGVFLDWHAISIQRVDRDPAGAMRVYFFNPNHDKGQDWGQGVVTATCDNGEMMGESSLPFAQFCSRLYVFHYDAQAVGDPAVVPADVTHAVVRQIADSWAQDFPWADGSVVAGTGGES